MSFTSTLPTSGVPCLDSKLQKAHDIFHQQGLLFFDEFMEEEERLLMHKRSYEVSFIFYSILTHFLSMDTWEDSRFLQCDKTMPYWKIHFKVLAQGIRNHEQASLTTDFFQQFVSRRNRFIAECVSVSDNYLIKNIANLTYFYFYKPCDFTVPLLDTPSQEHFWNEERNLGDAANLMDAAKAVFKELKDIAAYKMELVGDVTYSISAPVFEEVKTAPKKQLIATAIKQHPHSETVAVVRFDDGSEASVLMKYFTGTDPVFLNGNNQLLPGWHIENGWIFPSDAQKKAIGLADIPIRATGLAPHPDSDKVVIVNFDNGQKAIASIAEHFSNDFPIFTDQGGYLLPGWTIINNWITPAPKPFPTEAKPFVPPSASAPKSRNPMDFLRAAQLSSAFIEMYAAEYGMKKTETIFNKVRFSSKVAKYIDHLKTQKLDPGVDGFLAILNSIPYFICSKGETICMGALIAINKWLEAVEYTSLMPSEERLHQIVKATILKTEATKMHVSGSNFFDKYFSYLKEQMQES